jgi:hypothetical protein
MKAHDSSNSFPDTSDAMSLEDLYVLEPAPFVNHAWSMFPTAPVAPEQRRERLFAILTECLAIMEVSSERESAPSTEAAPSQ